MRALAFPVIELAAIKAAVLRAFSFGAPNEISDWALTDSFASGFLNDRQKQAERLVVRAAELGLIEIAGESQSSWGRKWRRKEEKR